MARGKAPGTTPGPCPRCGRAKVWKADSRRATGGYWTCPHREVGPPRAPRAPRQARQRAPRDNAPRVEHRDGLIISTRPLPGRVPVMTVPSMGARRFYYLAD